MCALRGHGQLLLPTFILFIFAEMSRKYAAKAPENRTFCALCAAAGTCVRPPDVTRGAPNTPAHRRRVPFLRAELDAPDVLAPQERCKGVTAAGIQRRQGHRDAARFNHCTKAHIALLHQDAAPRQNPLNAAPNLCGHPNFLTFFDKIRRETASTLPKNRARVTANPVISPK